MAEKTNCNKDRIIQIGIRVKDLDASAKAWGEFLGVTPVFGKTDGYEATNATFRGKPCHGAIRQALLDIGNTQIELIASCDDDLNGWTEGADVMPEGLHHLAFKVDDMDKALEEMKDQGLETIQRGCWKGDPPGQYAYIDGRNSLKTVIELLAF